MKKLIILIVIIISAGILIYQYKSSKKSTDDITQQQPLEQTNKNIQPPAGNSNLNEQIIVENQVNANVDYKTLAQQELTNKTNTQQENQGLPPEYMQLTNCRKTLEDIEKEYGEYWGPVKPKKEGKKLLPTFAFSHQETQNIYSLLSEYGRCASITQRSPYYCQKLLSKYKKLDSNKICNNDWDYYNFILYTLNRNNDISSCNKWVKAINDPETPVSIKKAFSKVNPKIFCKIAKDGFENICDELYKANLIQKSSLKLCYSIYPRNISDCGDNQECITEFNRRMAIKQNNIDICPDKECSWFIMNNINACNDIKNSLIITYCDYYKKLKEKIDAYQQEEEMKKIQERTNMEIKNAKKRKKITVE